MLLTRTELFIRGCLGGHAVCLPVCLLLLSSQQPPAPAYMSQPFVYWSVLEGLLFMLSLWCTLLFPNAREGRFGSASLHFCIFMSELRVEMQQKTHSAHIISRSLFISLYRTSRGSFVVPLNWSDLGLERCTSSKLASSSFCSAFSAFQQCHLFCC